MNMPETNAAGTVRGTNDVYVEPAPHDEEIYNEDPGHLREAPWQAHLDSRYGVLARSFTNARSASEVDRKTIKELLEHEADSSHSALLSMPATVPTKIAAPATLADRVRQLCGRM